MKRQNSTKTLIEFVINNQGIIKKFEVISLLIFFAGLTLFVLGRNNLNFLLILGSILTSICYFLFAFNIVEFENYETTGILNSFAFINFIYKLTYLSLSITAITMIRLVVEFKSLPLIFISGLNLIIILFISSVSISRDKTNLYSLNFFLKIIVALLLLLYLWLIEYKIN